MRAWSARSFEQGVLHQIREMKLSDRWVFPRKDGSSHVNYSSVSAVWRVVRRGCGLDTARIHDLRHTVGTELARQGRTAKFIANVLGHADLRSTEWYMHFRDAEQESAALDDLTDEWGVAL